MYLSLNVIGELMDEVLERQGVDHTELAHVVHLAEECGEVARAALKGHQGIRGTPEFWREELRKELGQLIVSAAGYAHHRGIDLQETVEEQLRIFQELPVGTWLAPRPPNGETQ